MTEICELCTNKYPQEMIIDKKFCDFNQCYDCLFSMNFNDKNIINGSMGINLKDYIELSIKNHANINEIPCSRLSDAGGCYICMKLLDIPFDIPNIAEINKKDEPEEIKKEDNTNNHTNTNTDFQSHILTINNNDIFFDTNKFIISI